MFSDEPYCDVCGRRGDGITRVRMGRICSGCAERVGAFLLRADDNVLAKLWKASGERLRPNASGSSLDKDDLRKTVEIAQLFHEVGMTLSAIEHAAHILTSKPGREIREQALQILFDPAVATPALVLRLRERLFPI